MGEAAVKDLSETEDNFNPSTDAEEEEEAVCEEKEEEAVCEEVITTKASSPQVQTYSLPSRSPSPVKRFSLVDINNVPQPANNSDEVKELKQTLCALKERLVEMEARATQCTSPSFPSSSARMSMPFGSFPLNPWAYSMSTMMPFTPPNMISQFETPRSTFAELYDDDIEFEGVFSNYGSASPIKIRREVVEDCWRKACSRSNFAVLLARKAFSEKERATSNCTGDHRYKKSSISQSP